jgi:CRP/FNR family cyclic AMP-dependent transcriptional regulator
VLVTYAHAWFSNEQIKYTLVDMQIGTGATSQTGAQASPKPLILEDPLAYLPCSPIVEYAAGQVIYRQNEPSTRIYLVIAGKVKISRQGNGGEVVMDVYQSDEFFGESALAGPERRMEMATALEHTKVMSWYSEEIEENAALRPKLALAFLQLLVRRTVDFGSRIESFSAESVAKRLTRTLVRFAQRFGSEAEDGTVKMSAFTHELLAQYVGTSREIVTHNMSRFRRDGYLQYSREGISLHPRALTEWN